MIGAKADAGRLNSCSQPLKDLLAELQQEAQDRPGLAQQRSRQNSVPVRLLIEATLLEIRGLELPALITVAESSLEDLLAATAHGDIAPAAAALGDAAMGSGIVETGSELEDLQCAICQESFVEGQLFSKTPCPCVAPFHPACLDPWLQVRSL